MDMPVRLNKPQREFVKAIVSHDAPEHSRARRAIMAQMREAWFHDLAKLYPAAVKAIDDALKPGGSAMLRTNTARWLVEQRRQMVAEEREAIAAASEAETAIEAKAPHEMTQEELVASIARWERIAAAEDAQIVPNPDVFE
jgi:hypothetical protein